MTEGEGRSPDHVGAEVAISLAGTTYGIKIGNGNGLRGGT